MRASSLQQSYHQYVEQKKGGAFTMPPALPPSDALHRLDKALCAFWASKPRPSFIWNTKGSGGTLPNKTTVAWEGCYWSVAQMARIDFFRGTASDDWGNAAYASLLQALPGVVKGIASSVVVSVHAYGTWIETMVGVAYAVATKGASLCHHDAGYLVVSPPGAATPLTEIWHLFEAVGFRPAVQRPADRGTGVSSPPPPPDCPSPASPPGEHPGSGSAEHNHPLPTLLPRTLPLIPRPKAVGPPHCCRPIPRPPGPALGVNRSLLIPGKATVGIRRLRLSYLTT